MVIFYRRMPRFDYARARSIEEALELIADEIPLKHQVFAGGSDLLPKLKSRAIKAPRRLIDLKGIAELDYLDWNPEQGLRIGALATSRTVGSSPLVVDRFTALAQGAQQMGSNQLQNRGTIAGNICNAVPSADSAPPLLAHGAQVVCVGAVGERTVELADFFRDAGETVLQQGELVKEIRLPPPERGERSVYLRLAQRGRLDLAIVGVAVSAVLEGGVVRMARIGLGSAAPVPVRAREAESALIDQRLDAELIANAARIASEKSRTRTSHRASADYRRMMIEVLTRRALAGIAEAATRSKHA